MDSQGFEVSSPEVSQVDSSSLNQVTPAQNEVVSNQQNLSSDSGGNVSQDLKAQYENIFNTQGKNTADNWLNQQVMNDFVSVQMENQSVIREVQHKYQDIYAVPAVKEAVEAYLKLDMDPNQSLKSQGFPEAMEYISSIYKSGYEAGMNLKNQNDAAKSRMGSSIMSSNVPSANSGRVFSRAEVAAMDSQSFMQNEKAIFDQMAKGLIK